MAHLGQQTVDELRDAVFEVTATFPIRKNADLRPATRLPLLRSLRKGSVVQVYAEFIADLELPCFAT